MDTSNHFGMQQRGPKCGTLPSLITIVLAGSGKVLLRVHTLR
jgi:hypothetical protein